MSGMEWIESSTGSARLGKQITVRSRLDRDAMRCYIIDFRRKRNIKEKKKTPF